MFSGAQISLYPMCDDFVGVILGALSALDPYRPNFRIETDDISTLIVGPPEQLFPAMRDLFASAAASGVHCVLSATVSRGCPGEPDDPICTPISGSSHELSLAERIGAARAHVDGAKKLGQEVAAQFSLYPLGEGHHMDEIYGCIDFLKISGVFDRSKNFCTKLRGDAGPVFATLSEAFLRFGAPQGHVALDLTVSANSPSPC
ncbi:MULTISPECIES: YkoF family thiamine/hydroxymethylpyrimidine-binding protein [unclassified Mesorhizobium]|uniref:YkoF family thiamine/hydroxymethylpyrimidine-binding protein n=1 Tax=unclassified Mesorhizobium TaxID=325217 RepID=UPI000F751028|nr:MULTISPECIES: YkoF family thiamine/hydroxymethylpyrimidine-binding protein [unclassified Mesorhizobium]AZO67082.1 HMP/thiamine-binding protein [Mesorhizobium sp. M6A.T.Cr.TU.016.01.1.1]RVB79179.1 HMP/thiamine-binding protein [Mesorhizobium sp. M6A.T.Cr.TU.014.01.1.1]RWP55431.1 MAG: HMP/thiamine-binding protein [Mesorhizobium sp.]RWP82423.1 MAG: HMP/thiamine-binding protein [Mesorhizobium sp.]RWQ10129.1 MAG: HMP/thiamine-binding protein [Mesorhizobium sp.]